jgi:hypothetical protein
MIERVKATTKLSNEPANKLLWSRPQAGSRTAARLFTKEMYCCISEGVSEMRLSSRPGTIDIPKIP